MGSLDIRPDGRGSEMFPFWVIIIQMGQPNKLLVTSEQFPTSFYSITTGSFTFFDFCPFQRMETLLTIMKQIITGYGI
jgi:hypothetical protein